MNTSFRKTRLTCNSCNNHPYEYCILNDSEYKHTCYLRFRQKPLEREELVTADVHLVSLFEAARDHAVRHFDGKVHLVDRPEDLVDFAYLGFVLEVDGGVEVRDFVCHERGAEHLVFDGV